MRWIGIQPRVPEQRYRECWRSDRQRKIMHPDAQISGVSFRNTGDEVRGACERQGRRKASDDRDDLQFQTEFTQRVIDRSFFKDLP